MGPRGVALLSITFVAGASAGFLASMQGAEETGAPGRNMAPQNKRIAETTDLRWRDGEESTSRTTEETVTLAVEGAELEEQSEVVGRSAADILRELERAYQELALLKRERLDSDPSVDAAELEESPIAEEEATLGVEEGGEALLAEGLNLAEQESLTGPLESSTTLAQVENAEVELAQADFSHGVGDADELGRQELVEEAGVRELTNIHQGDNYQETSTHQTFVVNHYSPVFVFNSEQPLSSSRDPGSEEPAAEPMSMIRWSSSLSSHNDPWAPIDYSDHHNPFSSMIGSESRRSSSSGFVFRLHSR